MKNRRPRVRVQGERPSHYSRSALFRSHIQDPTKVQWPHGDQIRRPRQGRCLEHYNFRLLSQAARRHPPRYHEPQESPDLSGSRALLGLLVL